jgi:N-acetyltransferase
MDWQKPVTLAGNHVQLEPMHEQHVDGLAAVGLQASIWEHMLYGEMLTKEDMRTWVLDILSRAENGTDLPFVVIHLKTGKVAGATRYLNMLPDQRGLEIGGTWYGLEYQRTAVNTECKYLLLQYAFESLKCIRVQFKTDLRNVRSQKAIVRIGAVHEGVLRNHMILPDGRYRDSAYYSILENEWPDVKAALEQRLAR